MTYDVLTYAADPDIDEVNLWSITLNLCGFAVRKDVRLRILILPGYKTATSNHS